MALVSDSIPNLIQGVSQQPDTLRSTSQLQAQENCYSSLVEGLTQRPPTEFVALISETPLDSAFIHTINRTPTQRFKAIFSNGLVQVYDLEGNPKTVNLADETHTLLTAVSVINGQTFAIAKAPAETALDFVVSGLGTATVTLQLSTNGSSWSDVATRTSNGTTANVTIGSNVYMRVIVSSWTSGTVVASVTYKGFRYLLNSAPKTALRAMTVADYTFIVNTEVTPAMSSAVVPTRDEEGLVFVKKGEYGSRYQIFIDETSRADYSTSTTDVTTLSTKAIADQLYNDLIAWAGAGFTFTLIGSVIWIKKTSSFKLRVEDAQGGSSLEVFKDSTTKFSNLPTEAPNGFKIGIDANPETTQGTYYVEAQTTQVGVAFGPVSWVESVVAGIPYTFDEKTMPYGLIHEVDDTFTFGPLPWEDRTVGDESSNLDPSFIGTPILDMAFYKNRLGFLADENFVFSEVGEYFNFWRRTVTQIKDNDVVDSRATDVKVSILRRSVPFNKSLILFSDQTQFEIPSTVPLTPKTVQADVVSNFESLTAVAPVNTGKVVNFLFDRENYVGMKEMFVSNSNSLVMEAEEVSAHIPAYIPSGAFSMSLSTLEGVSTVLTDGDPKSIYVYKTAWKDEKKVQSAWFRWNLNDYCASEVKVLNADYIESTLYILVQRNGKVFLEKIKLLPNRTDAYSSYVTILDRRIDDSQLPSAPTYNAGTNETTFTLPYDILSTEMAVVTRSVADNTPYADVGRQLTVTSAVVGTPTLKVRGNFTTNPIWIGQRMFASADLSKIYMRDNKNQIDPASKLQLLKGAAIYSNTGSFTVRVTPEGRDASDYIFTGRIVGDINNVIGVASLSSGRFPFSILSNNERVKIQIFSSSFLPFRISSIEWEGNYTKRSQGR